MIVHDTKYKTHTFYIYSIHTCIHIFILILYTYIQCIQYNITFTQLKKTTKDFSSLYEHTMVKIVENLANETYAFQRSCLGLTTVNIGNRSGHMHDSK